MIYYHHNLQELCRSLPGARRIANGFVRLAVESRCARTGLNTKEVARHPVQKLFPVTVLQNNGTLLVHLLGKFHPFNPFETAFTLTDPRPSSVRPWPTVEALYRS